MQPSHMSPRDELLVAVIEGQAYVRVRGKGSFKNSPALKEFAEAVIRRGKARDIILDMRECLTMDSTFMGILAGLAVRLLQEQQGAVILVNLNGKTRGLLGTLGLDHMVRSYLMDETPPAIEHVLEQVQEAHVLKTGGTFQEMARTMYDAHTMLVDVAPENLPRFRDVLEYLRKSLDEGS